MMLTFLEFYTTLMGFVLFKLYNGLGYHYPPALDNDLADEGRAGYGGGGGDTYSIRD